MSVTVLPSPQHVVQAPSGAGIDTVHVYAYQNPGSGIPVAFWGAATLGESRPAVGAQFANAGYSLPVTGKPAGTYLVTVSARTTATGTYVTKLTFAR